MLEKLPLEIPTDNYRPHKHYYIRKYFLAILEFSRVLSTRSCTNIEMESAISRNETGGVFEIYIPSKLGLTSVYCDMRTDGGQWIVSS